MLRKPFRASELEAAIRQALPEGDGANLRHSDSEI